MNILKKSHFRTADQQKQSIYKLLTKGQLPNSEIFWSSAKNDKVFVKGKSLIDFTSGILVANIGHTNKKIKAQIKKALNSNILYNYHYFNPSKAEYLESLKYFFRDIFEDPKFYLTTSGTEACETAIKLMLKHGNKLNPSKNKILSIKGNYHGRTAGAALVGADNFYKDIWSNIDQYFPKIDFPYSWKVEEKDGEKFFKDQIEKLNLNNKNEIAGIILESFQGWGTCIYPKSFVKAVRDFCNSNNCLLTFDEMQSGFYRGGKKFFLEYYEVSPDLICMGKGMGGGFPISGMAGKKEFMDNVSIGELSSTHAANPIGCIVGKEIIDTMENLSFQKQLEKNSRIFCENGFQLCSQYESTKLKSNFIGMVGAIVFDNRELSVENANLLYKKCIEKGLLLIKTGRESVKLAPPLNISKRNLLKAFNIIKTSLEEISISQSN